jgi:hypothetical protein
MMEHLTNTGRSNDGTTNKHLKIKLWNIYQTLEDQMREHLADAGRPYDGTTSRHWKIK